MIVQSDHGERLVVLCHAQPVDHFRCGPKPDWPVLIESIIKPAKHLDSPLVILFQDRDHVFLKGGHDTTF